MLKSFKSQFISGSPGANIHHREGTDHDKKQSLDKTTEQSEFSENIGLRRSLFIHELP